MGFCPMLNGYVDHWVKWEKNGDNWFCVRGFESGGWVKAVTPMCEGYKSVIVTKPEGVSQIELAKVLISLSGDIRQPINTSQAAWMAAQLEELGYRKFEIVEEDV